MEEIVDNEKLDLTIIITTSPIQSHPSTEVIDEVRNSFKLIDGLSEVHQIIVADGYLVSDTYAPKSGKISREMANNYQIYLKSLKEKTSKEANVTLVEREERW